MTPPADSTPRTLDLFLPDSAPVDTVRRHPLPFPLWTIGDQCLLYHWFDYAVNGGYEAIRIHATDRPAAVRQAVAAATLWPVPMEVVVLRSEDDAPPDSIVVNRMPGHDMAAIPEDGWALIELADQLGKTWLDELQADPASDLLRIGASCRIHPDAILYPPYFIGDNVFIGPGCEIGPHAIIGSGSMLAGANLVVRSQVSPHTFLGPMTGLEDCLLDGGILFNRRNRARIDRLESHLSSSFEKDTRFVPPPWKERMMARRLARRLRKKAAAGTTLRLHDGREIPGGPTDDLQTRVAWLGEVARGKMRLFGVLPRTRGELDAMPPEWRTALEHAPVGVFSYADCHGCHSTVHPDEALHAVYQATVEEEVLRPILLDFIAELQPGGFAP